METKTFDAPALYADHHVTEVRRILLELEGVTDVYASSAFQTVEVTYD
jgi:copper chaperone CopZ